MAELIKRQGQRTDLAKTGQPDLIGGIPVNCPDFSDGETRQVAAEKAGFGNAETYRQAKAVVTQAAPELVAAMDAGTVAVSTAAKLPKPAISHASKPKIQDYAYYHESNNQRIG